MFLCSPRDSSRPRRNENTPKKKSTKTMRKKNLHTHRHTQTHFTLPPAVDRSVTKEAAASSSLGRFRFSSQLAVYRSRFRRCPLSRRLYRVSPNFTEFYRFDFLTASATEDCDCVIIALPTSSSPVVFGVFFFCFFWQKWTTLEKTIGLTGSRR